MQSKQQRVLEALERNTNGLTARQISARYNVPNARATISNIRQQVRPDGFDVYAERRVDSNGRQKTFYCLVDMNS